MPIAIRERCIISGCEIRLPSLYSVRHKCFVSIRKVTILQKNIRRISIERKKKKKIIS